MTLKHYQFLDDIALNFLSLEVGACIAGHNMNFILGIMIQCCRAQKYHSEFACNIQQEFYAPYYWLLMMMMMIVVVIIIIMIIIIITRCIDTFTSGSITGIKVDFDVTKDERPPGVLDPNVRVVKLDSLTVSDRNQYSL